MLLVTPDTRGSHRVHSRVELFLQGSVLDLRGPLGGNRRLEEPGRTTSGRDLTLVEGVAKLELCVSRLHFPLTGVSLPAA